MSRIERGTAGDTGGAGPSGSPLLEIREIEVVYGDLVLALRDVSLTVAAGEVVALLGANGAGKTTTLHAAAGLLTAERGRVTRGTIAIGGRSLADLGPRDIVRRGVAQVLEGRHAFPHLTIEANLVTGALVRRPTRRELRSDLDRIYALFPRLRDKRRAAAGTCSGGEQQMAVIGRALMARPTLLLLDEPSMGLAPQLVEEIFAALRDLHQKERVSILLAEENARLALRHADRGYILETGRVVASGPAADLAARPDVNEFYLGVGATRSRRDSAADTSRVDPHPRSPI